MILREYTCWAIGIRQMNNNDILLNGHLSQLLDLHRGFAVGCMRLLASLVDCEDTCFPYLELRIWRSISPFPVSPSPAGILEQYPSSLDALSR